MMQIFVGLVAACLIGIGFVGQQHAAYREPLGEMLHVRLLLHLLRQPIWLAGIASMVAGQVVGAIALGESDVSRVEPMLTTNLLFALLAAHLVYHERLAGPQWLGAFLTTSGVALFLVVGQPHGGSPPATMSIRWVTVGAVIFGALVLARTGAWRTLRARAMLLAVAAGMLYGLQDGLTRDILVSWESHLGDAFLSWQPYTLLCIGVLGVLFAQSAFDAAPLRVSLPATTAAQPLTGIVFGIVVFREHTSVTAGALAAESISLVALVAGVILLGRSPMLAKPGGEAGHARVRVRSH